VKNWPRVSANKLADEIKKVASGQFDFEKLEQSVGRVEDDHEEEED
jgi:hypothetical protein